MLKNVAKFLLGLAIGAVGGTLIAKKRFATPRMPNAKIWQRILTEKMGELNAAIFMTRVEQRYGELKVQRPVFDKAVFNSHVVGNILPGLALYQILREDGKDVKTALVEIDALFEAWFYQFPPLNMRLNQLMKFAPENFDIFRKLTLFAMDNAFPAPGWQYDIVQNDENSLAFDIHHCFYIDVLKQYNAPELTPVFCKLDDILMGAMPESIKWGRAQTIGMGAEYCNFRWDYEPNSPGAKPPGSARKPRWG